MLMKCENYNYCQKSTQHAKQYFDWTTWVVWANSQFATERFLSLSFLVSWARTEVAPVDPFWLPRHHLMSFQARMCLLGVLLTYLPIYGVKWGVNSQKHKIFKLSYYQFYCVDPTKFCTPVKTIKYASWVAQKHSKQIQDDGEPPSWKIVISPQLLDWFWWNLTWCIWDLCNSLAINGIWKSKMTASHHVEKWKKCDISTTAWLIFTRNSIYAIARICHGNSICPSVCHTGGSVKAFEVRIMQFPPYSSPIPLVSAG